MIATSPKKSTKLCQKCGRDCPTTEFYRHATTSDRLHKICKRCYRRWKREDRRERHADYIAVDRKRSTNLVRRACVDGSHRKQPHKVLARRAVMYALREGKLKRLPCEVCGDANSQAHHDDYSKPLEVRWLCSTHHGEVHRKREEEFQ